MVGRGAMGSVWLADHLSLQSQVAVKFMAPAMANDEVAIRRFKQEARAAAEIRSPHVVQVFDVGEVGEGEAKLLYIVMELLDGMSLDKWVRTRGALNAPMLASVVSQVCKALGKAHERGILHRDIKPANVFIIDSGGEPFVKVLDFGVAKFSGEEAINMTAAGNMVGTPAFMSPEQLFHGKQEDHRGDLWSLAVVAYFALIGERPFEGKTLGELCVSIRNTSFKMPSKMRGDLNPDIDAWFARAFHPDLEARYQSAKNMAQDLERATGLATQMTSTPSTVATPLQTFPGTSVSSHTSLKRPNEPRRWPLAVGAAFIVAIALGGAAFLASDGDAKTNATAPAAPATTEPPADAVDTTAAETAAASAETDGVPAASGDPDGDVEVEVSVGEQSDDDKDGAAGANTSGGKAKVPPRRRPGRVSKPKDEEDDRSKRAADELGI